MTFLDGLEGMAIGAVDPVVITADTPIDYSQWENGRPWGTPRKEYPSE